MSKHYLNLQAETVGTENFLATLDAMSALVDRMAMGAFTGSSGLGKTFAVETAREMTAIATCSVVIPQKATMRSIAQTLLRGLTGVEPKGERFRLADDLVAVLSEEPRLVVVDEAQKANHDCIEFLRHLHDDERTQFALALTGGNGCSEVLNRYPMLRSRIYRQVAFEPMGLASVLEVMPEFHDIYVDSEKEALARIDADFAHGNFRDWAGFTVDAIDACESMGRSTVDGVVVDEVLQRRRGRHATGGELSDAA